jgi:hypothetical protein
MDIKWEERHSWKYQKSHYEKESEVLKHDQEMGTNKSWGNSTSV